MYPLISEYIESIKSAEDNFDELSYLRPVLDVDGQPVMTSGNFAVVFKMEDIFTNKFYALKCFTKEQEGREEAYHQIAEELKNVESPYLISIQYLDKELFVDTEQTTETEFPVLLMDWVEGKTLDKYLRENLDDEYALEMLAYRFSQLAQWLIPQPFAHGDLKPDNILVREDGTLVLVDYDGMYVPAMRGQKARELGSPDFRHPLRTEDDFDGHIDDFPLVSILLSLKAISCDSQLLLRYGATDGLLFSERDYRNLLESQTMDAIKAMIQDSELATLYSLFILSTSQDNLSLVSFRLLNLSRPQKPECENLSTEVSEEDVANAWVDEFGVKYSADKKRLLEGKKSFKGGCYIINDKVQIICNGAFQCCKGLENISIPNSVKIIGEQVFWECENLRNITIPSSVIYIGDGVFYDCRNLKHIIIDAGNPDYDSRDNCNAIIDSRSNTLIVGCQNTHIPYGVTNIKKGAFSSVSNLFNITIPNSLIHIPDEAFYGCNSLTSVIIQNGVKTIGTKAFSGCYKLTNIVLPNSVTSIGERAFAGCDKLKSIIIPRSVTSMGRGPFSGIRMNGDTDGVCYGYNNLERIIVDIDNPKYDSRDNCNAIIETQNNILLAGCQNTVIPDGITSIDTWAFDGCEKLTKIVIPGSIASIPDFVFEFCTGLTDVTLRDGITSIGKMAFHGCEKLSSIIFPDSLTSIGERAFAGCDKLKSIIIPNGVSNIGNEAFAGMDSLKNYQGFFNGRNNIESIKVDKGNVFYDSRDNCNAIIETQSNTLIVGCKNTIIPNTVKSIGISAFAYCEELTAIEIPDGVTEIMDYAFYQCKSLKKVVLPNSVTKIGRKAFGADANCGSWGIEIIPTICIPNGTNGRFKELLTESKGYLYEESLSTEVTEKDRETAWVDEYGVKYSAFKTRLLNVPNNIKDYTIRKGTNVICARAFNNYRDNNISSVIIPDTITTIGERAFSSCRNLISITIPKSVMSIEKGVFSGCICLERIKVESGNAFYDSRDNCNAIIETRSNTLIVGCKKTIILDGISCIGDSAFSSCEELKSIIIPEGVMHIGNYAFNGCDKLTRITIPSSVVSIGEGAFGACKNLQEITLLDGISRIGKGTFEYCENLICITIPKSVTSIGDRAFAGCKSLTNIFVPQGSRNDFEKQLPAYKDIIVEG